MCNHSLDLEYFHHPKNFFMMTLQYISNPELQTISFAFYKSIHINRIMQFIFYFNLYNFLVLSCCSWYHSFLYIAELYSIVWRYHNMWFTHQFLAIWITSNWLLFIPNAVMNICIHIFLWTCFYFSWGDT